VVAAVLVAVLVVMARPHRPELADCMVEVVVVMEEILMLPAAVAVLYPTLIILSYRPELVIQEW
jgi:hypothetical protein